MIFNRRQTMDFRDSARTNPVLSTRLKRRVRRKRIAAALFSVSVIGLVVFGAYSLASRWFAAVADTPVAEPVVRTVTETVRVRQPASESPQRSSDSPPGASSAAGVTTSQPAAPAIAPSQPVGTPVPVPVPVQTVPPRADDADVRQALDAWADAWSRRDLAAYEAAYAPGFKGRQSSHAEWLRERSARILPRTRIAVTLSDIRVSIDGSLAEVQLQQQYESDGMSVRAPKALQLQRIDQRWLIVDEVSR